MTLAEFITAQNISIVSTRISSNPNMSDMPHGSRHWRCTLRRKVGRDQRLMSVPFSQGPAHKSEPTALDVLTCVADDAFGFENAGSFEQWTREYDFDLDSMKALQTYRAVERQARRLKSWLDEDAYTTLVNEVRDYV